MKAPKRAVMTRPESLRFASWCPDDNAQVPPTQVHMLFDLRVLTPYPVVMRLHSARVTDEIIGALIRHRLDVWPDAEPPKSLREMATQLLRIEE